MTSTTGAQPSVAGLFGAPDWSFLARLRAMSASTAAVVSRSLASARAYDGAQGTAARRAVLREFAGTR
ncbi:hypothetical protein GCU60_09245 [Blastococcus saxobsidens]|uniref:Uncharacterized protein n=1 Tax=Blastococcus saxobsidens TaxID=138336 RepID=A0A6L9W1S9_9ACTN|nr:hypothetical protein [Blastococcus saxobsidens]NEK85945.1 hypothetical protein [Blastococcus saxobsidens]